MYQRQQDIKHRVEDRITEYKMKVFHLFNRVLEKERENGVNRLLQEIMAENSSMPTKDITDSRSLKQLKPR